MTISEEKWTHISELVIVKIKKKVEPAVKMEKNQPRTEMEAAIDEIALQETLPINRQEQDEIERSLTEQQWQQELMRQDMELYTENTETTTTLQKVRDQEGREIESRLQKRWQDRKQKENEPDRTEMETGKGGDYTHPPRLRKG